MGGIFTRFFSWYAPYFNAYSFVFARGNEYEADAVSARLVGADSMGQALVRTDLAARRLSSRFWPDVQRLNLVQAEPPASLFGSMASAVRGNDGMTAGRRHNNTVSVTRIKPSKALKY